MTAVGVSLCYTHTSLNKAFCTLKRCFRSLKNWAFWKTPARVKIFRNAIFSVYVYTGKPGLSGLSPLFVRLLIGQRGFAVEVISPPVGLACAWQPLFANVCTCGSGLREETQIFPVLHCTGASLFSGYEMRAKLVSNLGELNSWLAGCWRPRHRETLSRWHSHSK